LGDDDGSNAESEPVMSLYLLDVVFWILEIRGPIPQDDDFCAGGGESSLAPNALMQVLAAAMVSIAVLALVLWAAVWLTIKLL
jgi:hypothetical protein